MTHKVPVAIKLAAYLIRDRNAINYLKIAESVKSFHSIGTEINKDTKLTEVHMNPIRTGTAI